MRAFLKNKCVFLVLAVILTTFIVSTSGVPAKEHNKKKLLEKLRSQLNQTEIEEASTGTVEVTPENGAADGGVEAKVSEDETPEKTEEESEGTAEADEKKAGESDTEKAETVTTDVQKGDGPTSYLLRMKTILKRIFDLFGFRQSKKKEGRQHRMLTDDEAYSINGLEYDYFKDDIRTTVGAVLGEKECIQKIVCGAGSYLRSVNGKNVILTVLENVTPSGWVETMELFKQSAVTDGDCSYKCLEDEEE